MEIDKVSNIWQLLAFLIMAGLPSVAMLAKYWINKSDEREAKRAEERGKNRDARFMDMEHKLKETDTKVNGLGKSFDDFKDDHRAKEEKKDEQLKDISKRIVNIEANLIQRKEFIDLKDTVHSVDKSIIRISTILDERLKAV